MVIVYTVPSTKYVVPPGSGTPLDEIEITGPPPLPLPQGQSQNASFNLNVKTQKLSKVTASITLTRLQHIPAGAAANLGPAAGAGTPWTFSLTPVVDPYEARWVMQVGAADLVAGDIRTFTVQFMPGTTPGLCRLTYRVDADELNDPVETTYDITVGP